LTVPEELGLCPRLGVLRLKNNKIASPDAISSIVLKSSDIGQIELDGNPVMSLGNPEEIIPGYEEYLIRRKKRIDKQIQGGLHPM